MMQQQQQRQARLLLLASLLFVVPIARAFAPLNLPNTNGCVSSASTRTCLHLTPSQGSQLAAAWNAACSKIQNHSEDDSISDEHSEEEESSPSHHQQQPVLTATVPSPGRQALRAARSFVSTVTHLPGSHELNAARAFVANVLHRKDDDDHNSILSNVYLHHAASDDDDDDVVLYPIVGFRIIRDSPTHVRALPTVGHAACRIPSLQQQHDEKLVGWYSPACRVVDDETTRQQLRP